MKQNVKRRKKSEYCLAGTTIKQPSTTTARMIPTIIDYIHQYQKEQNLRQHRVKEQQEREQIKGEQREKAITEQQKRE